MQELFDGLRYAPAETLDRQMLAAEALALELEPFELYGRAAITHRVTGFRSETPDEEPPALVGQALLTDLSSFVERLSERLQLRAESRPGGAVALDEAAARLGVSARSLLRYRSLGLVVHWIDFDRAAASTAASRPHSSRRVGCFIASIERFRARRLGDTPRGRPRTAPLPDAQRHAVIASAERMTRDHPTSLRRAAAVVAAEHAISPRTAQALLRSSDLPFARPRRRRRDDVRFATRAWRIGIDPARIAERQGRDHAAGWRAVNAGRKAALRAMSLPTAPALPTFELTAADEVLLAPECVRRGLHAARFHRDGMALLAAHPPVALPPRAGDVDACRRLVGMRFLLWRAERGIAALHGPPTNAVLDRIETDLRNAWLLRRTLVVHALPSVLGRIEAAIGGRLGQASASVLATLLQRAFAVTAASLDSAEGLDAADGRLRVGRHAALLMDREMAQIAPTLSDRRPGAPLRASAVHRAAEIPLPDPDAIIAPWFGDLPLPFAPPTIERVESRARSLLEARYGWSGSLAKTIIDLARMHRVAPSILQHRVIEAMAQLRA